MINFLPHTFVVLLLSTYQNFKKIIHKVNSITDSTFKSMLQYLAIITVDKVKMQVEV